jgi:large subunit ribosomal protein L31e
MVEQKEYNIPLRKEFLKVPKYKRAKKAVTAIKEFLKKHMKKDDIKIGPKLNDNVWEKGIKNPPHHVKVSAHIDGDSIYVEKTGYTFKRVIKEKKKEKTTKDKLLEKIKGKEKKEVKDLKDSKEVKDLKDSKEVKDLKDSKEVKKDLK